MLEPSGRRVLEIIGKDPAPKGIVLPAEIPAAISALEAAIAAEEADAKAQAKDADTAQAAPVPENVSLRQRALPFVDMLRRSLKGGHEIVWGV